MTRELTDLDLASMAIDKGDIAALDAALRRHPELVSTDRYGGSVDYSLLDEAASRGLLDACKLLIEAGASVNRSSARWRHDTPLCGAAYGGHKEVAQLLLNAGADPNGVATTASTPLMASATIGALDLVRDVNYKHPSTTITPPHRPPGLNERCS